MKTTFNMLDIILTLYSIVDITFIIFLINQYKNLIKSDEYVSESLINKFILGSLAIGGIVFTLSLLIATIYYIFSI
jgi:hypothetical protein